MSKLKNILENSMFSSSSDKSKIQQELGDYFWGTLFLTLGAYTVANGQPKIMNYLKKSPVQLDKIQDDGPDYVVIIKLLHDTAEDENESPAMARAYINELTRMFALMKTGIAIDETRVINLLRKFKARYYSNILKPSPLMKHLVDKYFMGDKKIVETAADVYKLSKRMRINNELVQLIKINFMDEFKAALNINIDLDDVPPVLPAVKAPPEPVRTPLVYATREDQDTIENYKHADGFMSRPRAEYIVALIRSIKANDIEPIKKFMMLAGTKLQLMNDYIITQLKILVTGYDPGYMSGPIADIFKRNVTHKEICEWLSLYYIPYIQSVGTSSNLLVLKRYSLALYEGPDYIKHLQKIVGLNSAKHDYYRDNYVEAEQLAEIIEAMKYYQPISVKSLPDTDMFNYEYNLHIKIMRRYFTDTNRLNMSYSDILQHYEADPSTFSSILHAISGSRPIDVEMMPGVDKLIKVNIAEDYPERALTMSIKGKSKFVPVGEQLFTTIKNIIMQVNDVRSYNDELIPQKINEFMSNANIDAPNGILALILEKDFLLKLLNSNVKMPKFLFKVVSLLDDDTDVFEKFVNKYFSYGVAPGVYSYAWDASYDLKEYFNRSNKKPFLYILDKLFENLDDVQIYNLLCKTIFSFMNNNDQAPYEAIIKKYATIEMVKQYYTNSWLNTKLYDKFANEGYIYQTSPAMQELLKEMSAKDFTFFDEILGSIKTVREKNKLYYRIFNYVGFTGVTSDEVALHLMSMYNAPDSSIQAYRQQYFYFLKEILKINIENEKNEKYKEWLKAAFENVSVERTLSLPFTILDSIRQIDAGDIKDNFYTMYKEKLDEVTEILKNKKDLSRDDLIQIKSVLNRSKTHMIDHKIRYEEEWIKIFNLTSEIFNTLPEDQQKNLALVFSDSDFITEDHVLAKIDKKILLKVFESDAEYMKRNTGRDRTAYKQAFVEWKIPVLIAMARDKVLPPAELNRIFDKIAETQKPVLVKICKDYLLMGNSIQTLFESHDKIKPSSRLNQQQLIKYLRINQFSFASSKLYKKDKETFVEFIERTWIDKDKFQNDMPEIKITDRDETAETMEIRTAEFFNMMSKGQVHGNTGLVFLHSFDVNLEVPQEYLDFAAAYNDTRMFPMLHGTDHTAAAFILRFGFAITSGDLIKAGRMLGNGIYVTNVIDKAAQYTGDKMTRKFGTKGIILECEVYLGKEGEHFRSAGVGNNATRSPEWCIYNPGNQIKIVRAHEVEINPIVKAQELYNKHKDKLQKMEVTGESTFLKDTLVKFRTMLNEAKNPYYIENNEITFIFCDGNIPIEDGKLTSIAEFKKKYKLTNCYLQQNQYGMGLSFHTKEDENGTVFVSDTDEFIIKNPGGEYDVYKKLFRKQISKK